MKKLLALLICLSLLVTHVQAGGGKTFRRKELHPRTGSGPSLTSPLGRFANTAEKRMGKFHPTLGRGASPRRSTPFLRSLQRYTEQTIRNTVRIPTYSYSSIVSVDQYLAAIKKSLESPREISPTLFSRLKASATADVSSPDLTVGEFWDLAVANMTQSSHWEFFKRVFPDANKDGRPVLVVLKDLYVMGGYAEKPRRILIPKGTQLKLLETFKGEGNIVVGSRDWNAIVQKKLNEIKRNPQRIEALRQRALRPPLEKDVYVTKQELTDLLFSKKANKFFGPPLLIYGRDEQPTLVVPIKQSFNVAMPSLDGGFKKYEEFSYAVPKIDEGYVRAGKGDPLYVSFYEEKRAVSREDAWTPERIYQLLHGSQRTTQTLFTRRTDPNGKTVFIPKQRMLYTNGENGVLYVLSESDILRVRWSLAKGNSIHLLTEAMTYEQFKQAVLTGTFEKPKVVKDGQEMRDPNAEIQPAPKKPREKTTRLPTIDWRKLLEEQGIDREFVGKKVEKFTLRYATEDKRDVIFRMLPVKMFFVLPNGEEVTHGDYLDFTSGELVVRSEWAVRNLFIKIEK